ncbi:MAG: hypothetical protein ACPLSN_05380 [Dictyoglomus turgidum]
MKRAFIIGVIFLLLIGLSLGNSLKIKNDETVYVLLDYDGKAKKVDLVNWIEVQGQGGFEIVKDARYIKNPDLYSEDLKMDFTKDKIRFYGNVKEVKNIYYKAEVNRKLPLEFKFTYKYNGKVASPKEFLGKSGNLDIEIYIKPIEDLPFRIVMSTEFPSDDLILRNPEDFMVMVLGKTVRVTGFTYPIPDGKIILSLKSNKLKVPDITFTALPSLPPVDLSTGEKLKEFYNGLEGFLMLNQAHQKILKGILESLEKNTLSIPQEFLTLPFTLMSYQNKAYFISDSLKTYPKSFNNLYEFIKSKAEGSKEEDWKKALSLVEEVKKEIEENNMSDDVKKIGDFLADLNFQSKKAMDLLSASLEGLQKMEELLNTILYGGEIEGKKLPGLVDVEKNMKKSKDTLKSNLMELEKGEKKLKEWENKLKDYNFAGRIEGAKSIVRFYFKLKEMK